MSLINSISCGRIPSLSHSFQVYVNLFSQSLGECAVEAVHLNLEPGLSTMSFRSVHCSAPSLSHDD